MAQRRFIDRNIRKLTKLGNTSLAVTIPMEIVSKLKLKEKQKVIVRLSGAKIVIEDWKE